VAELHTDEELLALEYVDEEGYDWNIQRDDLPLARAVERSTVERLQHDAAKRAAELQNIRSASTYEPHLDTKRLDWLLGWVLREFSSRVISREDIDAAMAKEQGK
jgi:hypothetical protein